MVVRKWRLGLRGIKNFVTTIYNKALVLKNVTGVKYYTKLWDVIYGWPLHRFFSKSRLLTGFPVIGNF